MSSGIDVQPTSYAAVELLSASSPRTFRLVEGLTGAPQTFPLSARPAARMTWAALWSRSWIALHAGHVHSRTCSDSSSSTRPHALHVLLDASQRDTKFVVRPFLSPFSPIIRTNCAHPESATARARRRLRTIPAMLRSSRWITWLSRTNARAVLVMEVAPSSCNFPVHDGDLAARLVSILRSLLPTRFLAFQVAQFSQLALQVPWHTHNLWRASDIAAMPIHGIDDDLG
jgi:hypothetical protein